MPTRSTHPLLAVIQSFLSSLLLLMGLMGATSSYAQPTFSKVFTPDTIGPGSVSTLTFTITNSSLSPVTDLAFTDTLPVGVVLADPANALTDCGLDLVGGLNAPNGGSTITFSGGLLGIGTCTIDVDVTSSTAGTHTNTSGGLTSSAGNSGTASNDLMVVTTLPGVSKTFMPSSIPLGDRSTLTLTIDNSANGSFRDIIPFTDNLPSGIEIANPANASTTCSGSIITAISGTSTINSSFFTLLAGTICTITVDVTGTAVGLLNNITEELTSTEASSGKASASLEVTVTPIALQKSFIGDPIPAGSTVILEFTLLNIDRLNPATTIAFSDDFTTLVPAIAGLTFDSLLANDCGGSVTGVGGTTLSFSGGTLPPEGSCTIRASLMVPLGATPGLHNNTTDPITADINGVPIIGNRAADELLVAAAPRLTKTFIGDPINSGDSITIRFTITNTSTTSGATDITFLDELTTFLPFPITVTLPPVPDPPCGAGSSLTLSFIDTDRQGLLLTAGNLAAAPGAGSTCTFDVMGLTIPAGAAPGIYNNTTGVITATVDGVTVTGSQASDNFTLLGAPSLSKAFTDDPVEPGGMVTLEFTLTHSEDAVGDATNITFTDDLAPVLAGLTATLPVTPDPPCGVGSSLTGSAGNTLLTLQGGTLTPGQNCTFSVVLNVPAGALLGNHTNTTNNVSAMVGGLMTTAPPATDDLGVVGLIFSKAFIGDPVLPGDTVTLRFTIENVSPIDDATSISFTENLADVLPGIGPPDLTVILPLTPNPPCGVGSSIMAIGPTLLFFSGGELTVGEMCTFDITILVPAGVTDDTYLNVTSDLLAVFGGSFLILSPATDNLVINSTLLMLTKTFTDDPVAPGGLVTLVFTLTNLDTVNAASNIAFTDDFATVLSGLTFNSLVANSCGGSILGVGTTTFDFSTGTLVAGASCTIELLLMVPTGAAVGLYPNTTNTVTGMVSGFPVFGAAAGDNLEIVNLLGFSKSFDGPTSATGTPVLTFTLTNSTTSTVGGLFFSDNLDNVLAGLVATNLPLNDICGLGSSLSGTSLLTLTGGELAPNGGTCSFTVDLLVPSVATAGTFPNTTSDLFQAGLPVAPPATANLTIEPGPTFFKSFSPNSTGIGLISTLSFTIDNSASTLAANALAFTDNLPAGLVVATPANATSTCSGGTLTATSGTSTISLAGSTVSAGASCVIQVDLVATAAGVLVNTSGDLTSSAGNSGVASDTLFVNPPPNFSKAFMPNSIMVGNTSTLTFTIDNTGSTVGATSLDFTDNLPAAIQVATPADGSLTCTGGTLTANPGTSVISYSGGSIAAGASCTLSVEVEASAGSHNNTTGDLTSSLGNSGNATDTLNVSAPPIPTLSQWAMILLTFALLGIFASGLRYRG